MRSRVGEILVKAGVIDDLQLRSALAQYDQWGGRLGKLVADMGLADEEAVADAIARAMQMQRAQLGHIAKDAGALAKLDVHLAEEHGVFPVSLRDNGKSLVLAMADPTDLELLDLLAAKTRARIQPLVAGESEIQNAILRYYKNQEPLPAAEPRARQAHRRAEETAGEDDGEFKITDISGKTMIRHIGDIEAEAMTDPGAARAAPPAAAGSTGDLLDEILGGPSGSEFTPEDVQKLETLRVNQEKSAVILRALLQILVEKGYCTQRELAARMKP